VPPRWQPSLEDYIDLAAYLLDTEHAGVARLPRIALAESALHAPFASFGAPRLTRRSSSKRRSCSSTSPGTIRCPTPTSAPRACSRPASSTPTALQWGRPDVETNAGVVERVAAGDSTHEVVVAWIRERTRE
jgi:hypothetical protein